MIIPNLLNGQEAVKMEYLSSITQALKTISEDNIVYTDIHDLDDVLYGIPLYEVSKSFVKYPVSIIKEIENTPESKGRSLKINQLTNFKDAQICSCLRFKTHSKCVIIKAELRRKWSHLNINLWNSSGFDVYFKLGGQYVHNTVFAPCDGKNLFAEKITVPKNAEEVMIYLPTYNKIVECNIGVEGGDIRPADQFPQLIPIAFYGNSITQGASASRSGNTFSNIVSRQLEIEVYNYSISTCALGNISVANVIGQLNLSAIVIDYSRNAYTTSDFKDTYLLFYNQIRKYHLTTPIILMTSSNFNKKKSYPEFDKIICETYESAKASGQNVFLINQMGLFSVDEYDLCTVDGVHYNDYGMLKVANAISEVLSKELKVPKLF